MELKGDLWSLLEASGHPYDAPRRNAAATGRHDGGAGLCGDTRHNGYCG